MQFSSSFTVAIKPLLWARPYDALMVVVKEA